MEPSKTETATDLFRYFFSLSQEDRQKFIEQMGKEIEEEEKEDKTT